MAIYIVNSMDGHGAFTATVNEANGIDAGAFVKCVSTVEATATSTVVDKILVSMCDASNDGDTCVGIALEDGDNGELISVATRGMFRCPIDSAGGSITAGAVVQVTDETDATATIVELYQATEGSRPLGQALTTANTDAEFIVLRMSMGNGSGAVAPGT